MVALNPRDLFTAAKRLKALTTEAVLAKATASQRTAIRINDSLVRFHMSKVRVPPPPRGGRRAMTDSGPGTEVVRAMPQRRPRAGRTQAVQAREVAARLAALIPSSQVPGLLMAATHLKGTGKGDKSDKSVAAAIAELQVRRKSTSLGAGRGAHNGCSSVARAAATGAW